ncbi:MAG: hypothetical protein K9L73_01800 [Spirochaetia bacterium]|nr:hypothetical protein [Spirochaetia bacterium]
MEQTPYQIVIFGKEGCQKCHTLNQRVDTLLKKGLWSDFSKRYLDVMTEAGLVEFCNTECINPQRIPALIITRYDEGTGRYERMTNERPGAADPVCRDFRLYTYLGLQTDYTSTGTITPAMITHLLKQAKEIPDGPA